MAYLQALLDATEQVKAAAAAKEWDRVLTCLEERQALIARIDALSPEGRALSEADQTLARHILTQLSEADTAVTAVVEATLEETRGAINHNSLAQTTLSAYRRSTRGNLQGAPARFVDKNR